MCILKEISKVLKSVSIWSENISSQSSIQRHFSVTRTSVICISCYAESHKNTKICISRGQNGDDNDSTIKQAKNAVCNKRNKHMSWVFRSGWEKLFTYGELRTVSWKYEHLSWTLKVRVGHIKIVGINRNIPRWWNNAITMDNKKQVLFGWSIKVMKRSSKTSMAKGICFIYAEKNTSKQNKKRTL